MNADANTPSPPDERGSCDPSFPAGNDATPPDSGGLDAGHEPRENAVRHGLTADALLPRVVGPETIRRHYDELAAEWQPQGATEGILVSEMARHAAALEWAQRVETAIWQLGDRPVDEITAGAIILTEEVPQELLASGLAGEALDRVTRYRRAHERAFHQALCRLREIQGRRRAEPRSDGHPGGRAGGRFASEEACRVFLLDAFRRGRRPCPTCGSRAGYWLPSRRRWQCAGCRRQRGLREGTVMAGSQLPLAAWFAAIGLLCAFPDASITELAAATGVPRKATLRGMRCKILAAIRSPAASERLAGLERVYTPDGLAEASGAEGSFLRNDGRLAATPGRLPE